MDGTFVEALVRATRAPEVVKVNGVERLVLPAENTTALLADLETPLGVPVPLEVATLGGFCDYIDANRDELDMKTLVVHVVDHAHVELRSKLLGTFAQRFCHVRAIAAPVIGTTFAFGHYYDAEGFNVALQALFLESPDREKVLRIVGNIRDSAVRDTSDDGVTQTVVARAGIVLGETVPVPNPVTLAPFRTFREIQQPASPFILRLRSGKTEGERPTCALFEADGGQWKLDAIATIAARLQKELGEMLPVLA